MKRLDLRGRQFGALTAIRPYEERTLQGKVKWVCSCKCGRTTTIAANSLTYGRSKSCGCRWLIKKQNRTEAAE